MRSVPALAGSMLIPLVYMIMLQLNYSQWTAALAGFLFLFGTFSYDFNRSFPYLSSLSLNRQCPFDTIALHADGADPPFLRHDWCPLRVKVPRSGAKWQCTSSLVFFPLVGLAPLRCDLLDLRSMVFHFFKTNFMMSH